MMFAKYYIMPLSSVLAVALGSGFDVSVLLSTVSLMFYALLALWTFVERYGVAEKAVEQERRDLLVIAGRAGWLVSIAISARDYSGGALVISLSGGAVFLTGVGIRYLSMKELKGAFTYSLKRRKDQKLVHTGVYRFVRHPSYIGMILISLSIPLIYTSPMGFVLISLFTISNILVRIKKEEEILKQDMGLDYLNYMEGTKKLIPFIW